jgi:hypothetical protein
MSADGEQELMLGSGESGRSGLLFTPAFETPHPGSYGEQGRVRVVGKFYSYHDNIVIR